MLRRGVGSENEENPSVTFLGNDESNYQDGSFVRSNNEDYLGESKNNNSIAFTNIERDLYIKQKAERQQDMIVNFKSSTTHTKGVYVWTYRNTGCDVISIITTTVPIKNGGMKDIRVHNKEMRRIKPSMNKSTKGAQSKHKLDGDSPLEQGQVVDLELTKRKISAMLRAEKRNFMARLHTSRYIRTTIENSAASIIQKSFRGHYVRMNINRIRKSCELRKILRSNVRNFLESDELIKNTKILTLGQYKIEYSNYRNKSARLIQSAFRKFVSFKCLNRKRIDVLILRQRKAAIRIQCMARKVSASHKVKLAFERRKITRQYIAAVKIQTALRRLFARRRVKRRRIKLRFVAARIIQCWYRAKHSKTLTEKVKNAMKKKKEFRGALGVQCLIRKFVARRRTKRIRLRRMYLFIFKCISKIQSIIRGFNSRKRVIRIQRDRRLQKAVIEKNNKMIGSNPNEEEKQPESSSGIKIDIFYHSRKGNANDVDDTFHGRNPIDGDKKHETTETDDNGDTVLTITVANGHMAIVRKCLQWGFDINHRNKEGENALMIAVKNNHASIVQFILMPPAGAFVKPFDEINSQDAAIILCHAVANAPKNGIAILNTILLTEGLDINAKHPKTGLSPFLLACKIGHVEAVKILYKRKANINEIDKKLGQTCLHKSCAISVDVTKLLSGVDATLGLSISESERATAFISRDDQGRDCWFIAALNGQTEILKLINDSLKKSSVSRVIASEEELALFFWSPEDVLNVFHLVETGNVDCFSAMLDARFDPMSINETNGETLAMVAAKYGQLEILDCLMQRDVDLSSTIVDKKGFSLFHHASTCKDKAVIAFLLSHSKANKCSIHDMDMKSVDNNGDTPMHIAASCGVSLSVDLLARNGIESALLVKNKNGMTPLLVACSYLYLNIVKVYLDLGADATDIDIARRNCIWHLYHPNPAVLLIDRDSKRKTVAGEYSSRKASTMPSKKERELESSRISFEITIIISLIRAGCPFYSFLNVTPEDLLSIQFDPKVTLASSLADRVDLESGDIATQELSFSLLKALPEVLDATDLWRLVLSTIRFDDGSSKAFLALLDGGAIDVLINSKYGADLSNSNSTGSGSGSGSGSGTAPAPAPAITSLNKLESRFYDGMTIAGWILRLGNHSALQQLFRKGYAVTNIVDCYGNTCLHYGARYGIANTIDIILTDDNIKLEKTNNSGCTAVMEGAKYGNYQACKRLFKYGANARRGLDGKYWAWMLVYARKKEFFEKNLNTGRYGDDDETYFPSRDPYYLSHYDSSISFKQSKL